MSHPDAGLLVCVCCADRGTLWCGGVVDSQQAATAGPRAARRIVVDEVGAPLDRVAVTLCPGPVTATTTTAGFLAFDRLHLEEAHAIARSATHYGRIDAIRVGPIQHFELRDGRLMRAEP